MSISLLCSSTHHAIRRKTVKLTGIGERADAVPVQPTNGATTRFSPNELANLADWQLMELESSGSPQAPVELKKRDAAQTERCSPSDGKQEAAPPPAPEIDVFV
jgi:hypothetical protein